VRRIGRWAARIAHGLHGCAAGRRVGGDGGGDGAGEGGDDDGGGDGGDGDRQRTRPAGQARQREAASPSPPLPTPPARPPDERNEDLSPGYPIRNDTWTWMVTSVDPGSTGVEGAAALSAAPPAMLL
jgi:hypothetical protein